MVAMAKGAAKALNTALPSWLFRAQSEGLLRSNLTVECLFLNILNRRGKKKINSTLKVRGSETRAWPPYPQHHPSAALHISGSESGSGLAAGPLGMPARFGPLEKEADITKFGYIGGQTRHR